KRSEACLELLCSPFRVVIPLRARAPRPPLFPYTTLFRSPRQPLLPPPLCGAAVAHLSAPVRLVGACGGGLRRVPDARPDQSDRRDRKSTRLNSSHRTTSYAVFCLKKKTD